MSSFNRDTQHEYRSGLESLQAHPNNATQSRFSSCTVSGAMSSFGMRFAQFRGGKSE